MRYEAWWTALDDARRADASRAAANAIPDWMLNSLRDHDLPLVRAHLAEDGGYATVYLIPTLLRDFIEMAARSTTRPGSAGPAAAGRATLR